MAEVSEPVKAERSRPEEPVSDFVHKSMRKTKPGLKRLFLTLSVLFSFLLGFPFLWKSVEIYRAPLPFRETDHLSAQLDSVPLLTPCHFGAIFIGFNYEASISADDLESAISDLTSQTPQCGACSANSTVSVAVNSDSIRAIDFDLDDETLDELLEFALRGSADEKKVRYSVVVVNRGEDVRAVVGKYRHAWISGRVSVAAALLRAAEIFVKVFVNGGKEEGLIHGEFMPVGADGRIVLSFNFAEFESKRLGL